MDYSDELLAKSIGALRDATCLLYEVSRTVDTAEPVRRRLDGQLGVLDGVLDELERILDEARGELL